MKTPHFDAELHTLDNLSQIQANPPDAEICDKFKYKDFRGCKSVSQIQIRVTRMSSRSFSIVCKSGDVGGIHKYKNCLRKKIQKHDKTK